MRPRINRAQQVSQAEIESCEGYVRPRPKKTNITKMYTFVFGRKVYINESDMSKFEGFTILTD